MIFVQINTLLLADILENFPNVCLEIYGFDPARFLTPPRLAQAPSKKTKVKLDLLTYIDILLMVEKSIRGKTSHDIYQHFKANNKYMKDYYKNKESSFLKYWEVNNLYG